jgi:ATP-dependent protease ClpP protease subunit
MAHIRSTKLTNLRGQSWYSIVNKTDGPTQVHIYDEIGYVGVSAQQFTSDIAGIKGAIEVHLNTPGGEVFDGIAIYNCLKSRGDVTIIVDSLAASIGSVIAMAGNPTIMGKHSQMMIHDGFGMTVGNAADMREMADLLDKTSDNIASIYADRTRQPVSRWRDVMRNETWFSAEEAVSAGLADRVQGSGMSNTFDLSIFKNAKTADGKPFPGAAEPFKPKKKKIKKKNFDPDHDGDDDSAASGDTDHDYVLPDGSPGPKSKKKAKAKAALVLYNAKYKQDDRDRMAKSGEAMPDGSYPIADAEDLGNAVHAVGRGNADHDDIRKHVIKRAEALGKPEAIPDNWNSDGSLSDDVSQFVKSLRNALKEA